MMRFLPIPAAMVPALDSRSLWRVEGRSIVIFNVLGTLYAIDDTCPHAGASLANGKLDGRTVQCPAHGLRFDLLTGCVHTSRSFGVRCYIIEMRGGQHHLVLQEKDPAP
jgi:nitrite reductase/ring-hydroxylating ferredoxin subunit